MRPLRFFRTLEHLTVGQFFARLRHELWLRTRRRRAWPRDERQALSPARLPLLPETFARLRPRLEKFAEGKVEHIGVEGELADWRGADKPKLWRYEHHYHQELTALAARALEDPDGPWLEAGRAMQESWAAACPPEQGDAWEPYPVARRILSWAEAAALCPEIAAPELAERLSFQLAHLKKHLETHLLGNHLLCDAAALVAGGAMLAGSAGEAILLEGAALLERELNAQVLADGGYAERTFQYHALVLSDALLAVDLARARKIDLRPRLGELLSRMALWLWRARRPDGSWPCVNDASPDAFPLAAEALARAARLQLATNPPAPGIATEIFLPATGWSFLRGNGCELFFDTGLIGPLHQPGHGHDDALAYELRWFDSPVVTDSGVATYDRGEQRDFERSSRAHATISLDGEGIDEVWASFRVGGRGQVGMLAAKESDPRLRVLRGEARSFRGFHHWRTLIFWPGRALIVFDRVQTARKKARILSHIPLDPAWSAADVDGTLFLLGPGGAGLQLQTVLGKLERVERGRAGDLHQPRAGWVAQGFGKLAPRSQIDLRADERGRVLYAFVSPGVSVRVTTRGLALRTPGAEVELDALDML